MFVSQIDIKEFRGIKKCKKPIKLSNFTVLIGRNNSGKSTLIEALSLLPHPDLICPLFEQYKIDIINRLHSGKLLSYKYAGTAEINYIVCEKHLKINIEGATKAKVSIGNNKNVLDNEVADLMGWNANKQELESFTLFIPNTTETLSRLKNRIRYYWDLIVKLGAHTTIAEAISECIDENYTEIFDEGNSVRKEAKPPYYIKLEDLGDGIEKAIKVMLFFEAIRPKLVLWDDFDASSHPSLIKILLKWLSEKDWQVVLSTHSIDVLYNLLEVRPKDLIVLQLKKTEEDILLHGAISLDELEELIDANLDPRLLVDALGL